MILKVVDIGTEMFIDLGKQFYKIMLTLDEIKTHHGELEKINSVGHLQDLMMDTYKHYKDTHSIEFDLHTSNPDDVRVFFYGESIFITTKTCYIMNDNGGNIESIK